MASDSKAARIRNTDMELADNIVAGFSVATAAGPGPTAPARARTEASGGGAVAIASGGCKPTAKLCKR
jgi:hypothetical protein